MLKRRSESNRRSDGRRGFAAYLLLLLPGFMFLGLLAPATVSVQRKASSDATRPSVDRFAVRRPVLLAPRAIANASLPDAAAVELLFSGARYLGREPQQVDELPAVAAGPSGEIVLAEENAVEDYIADTLFDETMERPVLTVDLTPIWDPKIFDVIPGSILRDGHHMYDDFHGTAFLFGAAPATTVIPEPGTASLLAFGLVALALRARGRE